MQVMGRGRHGTNSRNAGLIEVKSRARPLDYGWAGRPSMQGKHSSVQHASQSIVDQMNKYVDCFLPVGAEQANRSVIGDRR
jgi:hypothetical protein